MRFLPTEVDGAFLIELEPIEDERGFFARTFCRRELAEHGIEIEIVQCNLSFNRQRGTLRGLHFQAEPWAEGKIISCTQGAIFDVIVDLRPQSPSYRRSFSTELDAVRRSLLYAPKGCAHGFQTLTSDAAVAYQMTEFYRPEAARGIRWNDPTLAIPWPLPDPIVSERDAALPWLSEIRP